MKNKDLIKEAYRSLETEDYEGAYQLFLEGAIRGKDPNALCGLAGMYSIGEYVGFDYDKCAHYYELAYEEGADIPKDKYIYIGCTYERDNPYHARNPLRAAFWYRKAIGAGIKYATECLGELEFKEGKYALARKHLLENKVPSPCALYYLGLMYEEGLGVSPEREKAMKYYRRIEEEYPRHVTEGDDHAFMALKRLEKLQGRMQ